ncbi:MAG: D-aminoacylase [Planctomycetota bacterium]|nr:D-aminoacylase [Planctomycetota bacterium]MDP6764250.1 D-aminoacylase [Planctomycetota bacterium]MDP6990408.1 D-aminoacylase [Planctomycetota bacterium]
MQRLTSALLLAASCACLSAPEATFDVLLRGGVVYDGTGVVPYTADVAIEGDRIAAIGDLSGATARLELDVRGKAVAPGFINMLSWAVESLMVDGDSLSDVSQGVTLEIFGEGWSPGPLTPAMKADLLEQQGDLVYPVEWTTLAEYLEQLVERGVSPNVASFVGATTVRIHELGYADRAPDGDELARMCELVEEAMEDGALGLGSSLIYAPAFYAQTEELIALARVAGAHGGRYITHMRSEGNRLLEGLEEVIRIAREAGVAAQVYHLKAAGRENWSKLDEVIVRIEAERAAGLDLCADMYTYTAAATGLDAAMPPWVQEGGYEAWAARLRSPEVRRRVAREMSTPSDEWENFLLAAGDPSRVLLVGFQNPNLKSLTGKSLAEIAHLRRRSVEDTAMDLVVEDGSRVEAVYFLMSEENVRRQITLPWIAFGSDAASLRPGGPFLLSNPHPRAYGNFARLLGRYVRDLRLIPLEEAVRRLTSFPAENLGLEGRGRLEVGYFADVVVFDPDEVADHATFDDPHQLSTGVEEVFVNGVAVLRAGEHTGARPGRVVRGPGWRGRER